MQADRPPTPSLDAVAIGYMHQAPSNSIAFGYYNAKARAPRREHGFEVGDLVKITELFPYHQVIFEIDEITDYDTANGVYEPHACLEPVLGVCHETGVWVKIEEIQYVHPLEALALAAED